MAPPAALQSLTPVQMDQQRNDAIAAYRQKLLEHKRMEAKLKSRL